MSGRQLAAALARWTDAPEQSTRAVGLIRIALGFVVLTHFANDLTVFNAVDPSGLLLGPLFFVVTGMMIVGYMARIATAWVAASILVIYLTGQYGNSVAQWNHHQVYLLLSATILLVFTPCGRSYSVDRYRAARQAERMGLPAPAERGPVWAQRLIVLQLAALYFWTAIDKSDWAWLSGDRLAQILTWTYSGRPFEVLLDHPALLAGLAMLVVAVEYGLAVGVVVRRWAPVVMPVGLALHAAFYLLLPVGTYSITMMVLYLAIPDPDAVHRVLDRLQGHAPVANRL